MKYMTNMKIHFCMNDCWMTHSNMATDNFHTEAGDHMTHNDPANDLVEPEKNNASHYHLTNKDWSATGKPRLTVRGVWPSPNSVNYMSGLSVNHIPLSPPEERESDWVNAVVVRDNKGDTTTGNDARTGHEVATTVGARTGDGVATVVWVAAIWDALFHMTAGGALVKMTWLCPDDRVVVWSSES